MSEVNLRKDEHIDICLGRPVEARKVKTLLDDVILVHKALPEFDADDVDTTVEFLGHEFSAPLIISAMTGGTERGKAINAALAEAAERLGIGIVVGSQRAALENPAVADTFSIVREKAPTAFVAANIGCQQLVGDPAGVARKCVEMIEADALTIHLNPLQECVQPGGEPKYAGCLEAIKEVCRSLDMPVIVKETGAGISREVARMLKKAGVSAIDVAGAGGTSWAAVEYYRARDDESMHVAEVLWDWGIPTAASILECRGADLPIIASGGIRTGLDVAKAIALGADLAGMALPLLKPALENPDAVVRALNLAVSVLRAVMFLTGSRSVAELKKADYVLVGELRQWAEWRSLSR